MRQHRATGTPIELYKALAKDATFPLSVAISSDSEEQKWFIAINMRSKYSSYRGRK
ncbi:hypothetical protein H0E87_010798 [Populus deltoides]|uniref:Uncharacterized protein n=1 Tax=Populus deltoides TaxID=3696 RepID=A0A8T2YUV1_POPDE|nr:hypothetical protein H0E87_010798 [Populus deltoides]